MQLPGAFDVAYALYCTSARPYSGKYYAEASCSDFDRPLARLQPAGPN